jgi:hypothetical protein
MGTPKGTRAIHLPVNSTDAVLVYSNQQHIWLQLRRFVPTGNDIGQASFKIAMCLPPEIAHKLGMELLNVAERSNAKQKNATASAA